MIYYASPEGAALMVIGNEEIKKLTTGEHCLRSDDGHVLIMWCPDLEWVKKEFRGMLTMGKGKVDAKILSYIMAEALKQPEVQASGLVLPGGEKK